MSLHIILLSSKVCLNLLFIQKLHAEFKGERQLFFKGISVGFDLLTVSTFKFTESLGILFLSLKKIFIPLLIEFLILLDVSLFTFIFLLFLIKLEFFNLSLSKLTFQLFNSVFGHLGFNVFLFMLTSDLMIVQNGYKVLNALIIGWILVESIWTVTVFHHLF